MPDLIIFKYISWEVFALSIVCLLNFLYAARAYGKQKELTKQTQVQEQTIKMLREDVKILYESASSLGHKLKTLEYESKFLKEQQEQLTLKEPNQQTYRNAIQSINNGESVSKIAETSGLSRGEVELLQLFQRVNSETSDSEKHKNQSEKTDSVL